MSYWCKGKRSEVSNIMVWNPETYYQPRKDKILILWKCECKKCVKVMPPESLSMQL